MKQCRKWEFKTKEDLDILNYYPKKSFYDNNNRPINSYYCEKNHYSISGGKVLADLAYNHPEAFKSIVKKVQSSLN